MGLSIEEIEMRLDLLSIQLAELAKIVNEIEAQAKAIEDGHV
jgi:hypothetical protein